MHALLRDAEMSILRHKDRPTQSSQLRELEVYPNDPCADDDYMTAVELDAQESDMDNGTTRRSPAALFGSQRIGSIVLPLELQNTINRMIAGQWFGPYALVPKILNISARIGQANATRRRKTFVSKRNG